VPSQLGLPSTELGPTAPAPAPGGLAAVVRLESGARLLLELDLEER
jgi:hypothetical protein